MIYSADHSPIFDDIPLWMSILKSGEKSRISRRGNLVIRYAGGMMSIRHKAMAHNGHSVVRISFHVNGVFQFTLYMNRNPIIPDIKSGNMYEFRLWDSNPATGTYFKFKKLPSDKHIVYYAGSNQEDVEHHMTIFQMTRDDVNESV